jgi:DeoR family fructose operon transcriptional repressor
VAENSPTPLFTEERKDRILKILEEYSKITVSELCASFHVSPVTIRNDLRDLSETGKLKRTHGGAIPMGKAAFEPDSNTKEVENIEEKKRIAARAAAMVESDDTIALDTGTTTFELAKCLINKKNLTVVTNDLKIASYLETNMIASDVTIVVIGGVLRQGFHCTIGPIAVEALNGLNVDKAFMATNAFSLEKGFTTPRIDQGEIKKLFMSISSEIIMLADSSKIGRIAFLKFADLNDVDKLIIDKNISSRMVKSIQEADDNIELLLV